MSAPPPAVLAAIVAGARPPAEPHPDAAILALEPEVERRRAVLEAARDAHDRIEALVHEQCGPRPEDVGTPAHDDWLARARPVQAELGFAAAGEACDAAHDHVFDTAGPLLAIEPRTLDGLACKARMLLALELDPDEELIEDILAVHAAGGHGATTPSPAARAVAAACVAPAEPDPDAALLALGREFCAAWAKEARGWHTIATGTPIPEEEMAPVITATRAVIARIEAVPATTLSGLAIKALAACWWGHDELSDDLAKADYAYGNVELIAAVRRGVVALDDAGRLGQARA